MRLITSLTLLAGGSHVADACTTFAAGKKATADGSVIVSQSSDGAPLADARLIYVPAADHEQGSQRAIYYANEDFPRMVTKDFGPDYYPNELTGQKLSTPIAHIPQVSHTFGYRDTSYGVINTENVGMGESTCSAMFQTCAKGTSVGCEKGRKVGEALMSIDTLTKIAMERATSARQAVQLMGDLAVKYGFYGSQDPNGAGEALQVGDAEEAFTFNILADPTGKSAIWAAQRVPDENVTVLSNMFTLRAIDTKDSFNFLASPNLYSVAQQQGWWKPGEPLDFTKVYSNGEYGHQYYAGRRMWGAFHRIAPSLKLSPFYKDLRYDRMYPWSTKPDKLITVHDVMGYYRDWYGGTQFDMTKGPAAGPFGSPDRFATSTKLHGSWERTIAIYRTNEIHIQQFRKVSATLPKEMAGVSWFANGAGHYSPFIPIPSGLKDSIDMLTSGAPHKFDHRSLNWACRRVASVCQIRFDKMHQLVEAKQHDVENKGEGALVKAISMHGGQSAEEYHKVFSPVFEQYYNQTLKDWRGLVDEMLFHYADNTDIPALSETKDTALGYTDDWLHTAGYEQGPPPVPVETQCPPKCPSTEAVIV